MFEDELRSPLGPAPRYTVAGLVVAPDDLGGCITGLFQIERHIRLDVDLGLLLRAEPHPVAPSPAVLGGGLHPPRMKLSRWRIPDLLQGRPLAERPIEAVDPHPA